MLAYARDSDPKLGLLWPVEWTTSYGKGRVYISTYGHVWPGDANPPGLRCAAVQTIIPRALSGSRDSATGFPVPDDFPGQDAVSVRSMPKLMQRSLLRSDIPAAAICI